MRASATLHRLMGAAAARRFGSVWKVALTLLVVLSLPRCGLDTEGGAAPGTLDASVGGLADVSVTTGGTGGAFLDSGAEVATGGVAGAAGAGGSAGLAGTGGSVDAGGGAGTGAAAGAGGTGGASCTAVGATCTKDGACCTGWCGPGVPVNGLNCNIYSKCAECRNNADCATGRCDKCRCEPLLATGGSCDEDDDCQSGECGPGVGNDHLDCNTYNKCAECRDDGECNPGRCDSCKCEPLLGTGASCNEKSDCASDLCGPEVGDDPFDCNTYNKCAECVSDGDCFTGRCDACGCVPQLGLNASCNEDSDCLTDDCKAAKCTKP